MSLLSITLLSLHLFPIRQKKIQSISLVFNKIVRFDAEHPDVKGGFTRVFKSFCRYFYEKKILVVTYLFANL